MHACLRRLTRALWIVAAWLPHADHRARIDMRDWTRTCFHLSTVVFMRHKDYSRRPQYVGPTSLLWRIQGSFMIQLSEYSPVTTRIACLQYEMVASVCSNEQRL